MWWELAVDLLSPDIGSKPLERSVERIVEKRTSGMLPVRVAVPDAVAQSLNESGWLADEVIGAGLLRQGKPPSLAGLLTGAALLSLARARPAQSLPREFALAVTAERVLAFGVSPWKEGEALSDSVAVVRIKPGERGSWPRASARLADVRRRMGTTAAMLQLADIEPFPVTSDGDPSTRSLIDLLSR
jgi:hypothetical protein